MANKNIKFDLQINGKSISTFEELRDNFSTDLLPIFQSGRLHKWFMSRKLVEKADAVKAIDMQGSELEQLTGISKVLELEGDDVALALIPVYFQSKHNIGFALYCNNPAKVKPIYIVNNNIIEELKPIRANVNANNSTLDKYVRVFIQPDEVLSEDGNTTNHIITAAVINDFSIEAAVKTGYFFTNLNDAKIEHSKQNSMRLMSENLKFYKNLRKMFLNAETTGLDPSTISSKTWPFEFDLQINGKRISTFEELRYNFCVDLLPIFQSGHLHKWFMSRNMAEQADAVNAIDKQGSELEQLTGICKVLELKRDEETLRYMLEDSIKGAQKKATKSKAEEHQTTGREKENLDTKGARTGVDFSGKDMSGRDFHGQDFRNGKFVQTNFSECNLTDADFSGADLTGALFEKSNLSNANFSNSILKNAEFKGIGDNFVDRTIEKGKSLWSQDKSNKPPCFNRSNMSKVIFKECYFDGVQFNQADISNSNISSSKFIDCKFQKANLKNAKLSDLIIDGTDFEGCDFSFAEFNSIFPKKKLGMNPMVYGLASIAFPALRVVEVTDYLRSPPMANFANTILLGIKGIEISTLDLATDNFNKSSKKIFG